MSSTDRRYPRFAFSSQPWVFSVQWKEPAKGDQPVRVEARNISRCGLKFHSNRKVALFEQVYILLFGKEDGKEIASLVGKVVRLEEIDTGFGEKTYGIALDFEDGTHTLHRLLPEKEEENGSEA
jgi:hypothetical protein